MGLHYKYASDAEATAAARLRTKKYIERIGIENYRAMVRKWHWLVIIRKRNCTRMIQNQNQRNLADQLDQKQKYLK